MSVRGADAELPQAPGFGRRPGNHVRSPCRHFLVKPIHALDEQIRYVGVVTQLARWLFGRAFAEHQLERVPRQKAPPIRTVAEVALKPEHINIETRGFVQTANGEYATGIDDAVHATVLQLLITSLPARRQAGVSNHGLPSTP